VSPELLSPPRRVLMTLDAVGGVWRYALDLARGLSERGVEVVLVGLGPHPSRDQQAELETIHHKKVFWLDEPLDWMAGGDADLRPLRERLLRIVEDQGVELLHLNLPSQAHGLNLPHPIVVVSHSCVVTWWKAVQRTPLPADLRWQHGAHLLGFRRADLILAPSRSHAGALVRAYGPLEGLRVLHNASSHEAQDLPKAPFVLGVARWWDEGKNARVLDAAAAGAPWPVLLAGPTAGPNAQSVSLRYAQSLGKRSAADVSALMERAAIFAAPSRYEPFGLAVLEAALRGAALLLADIPTFRELWSGAALFADPEDPSAWTDALHRLARDGEQRVLLGRLARGRAERFSQQRQLEGILETYREASLVAARRAA
jgi:glycosyltransferase involved in cell wall biosynthesis